MALSLRLAVLPLDGETSLPTFPSARSDADSHTWPSRSSSRPTGAFRADPAQPRYVAVGVPLAYTHAMTAVQQKRSGFCTRRRNPFPRDGPRRLALADAADVC